jgi:hypothetical protein
MYVTTEERLVEMRSGLHGDFAAQLAETYGVADSSNRQRLLEAFPKPFNNFASLVPTQDRMQLQRAEFDALDKLIEEDRRLKMTAVVDDDYPWVRGHYERALTEFLAACKANGRSV